MAWAKSSENGYFVATETLTCSPSGAGDNISSSLINFLPPGRDFIVFSNIGGANLSSGGDLEIHVCDTSNGTFAYLADADGAVVSGAVGANFIDISSVGEAPWYKLVWNTDGIARPADTIKIGVAYHKKGAIVRG